MQNTNEEFSWKFLLIILLKWVLTWVLKWVLKQARWRLNQLIPTLNQLEQYWVAHVDNENI
jgi:hypothetical protein